MAFMQEYWSEPIVPVQSLADSGSTVIPDRYIKLPNDRPGQASDSVSGLQIPVIDLTDGDSAAETIAAAAREWGFFQVVNHGVDPELMRRTREVWRDFFHLPMEAKRAYANTPKTYEGYGSRLGVEKGASLDWGDYYFLHLLPQSIKNHDKWPAHPPLLRETTDEYGREVVRLCGTMMRLLSLGLGLDEGRLLSLFGGADVGSCFRANFYPKCPQPDLALGLSPHSDPGGMTVLLVDDRVRGLQVRRDDIWVTIEPATDAFIVNMGDQIQVLTNAVYRSVEHRVVVNSEAERMSIVVFFNPRGDVLVGPMPEMVASPERPPLYKPMTFNEYRVFIREKGPRGKSQVESHKAAL